MTPEELENTAGMHISLSRHVITGKKRDECVQR